LEVIGARLIPRAKRSGISSPDVWTGTFDRFSISISVLGIDLRAVQAMTPVALFVYNRAEHTRKTIEALVRNPEAIKTPLIVYADAPKKEEHVEGVRAVREYIRTIQSFRSLEIVERKSNFGLSRSIVSGVTETLAAFGRVIVMEDDLVCAPAFLSYMNQALALYESEPQVASIHGYRYPVKGDLPQSFFLKGADCWGWATWRHQWVHYEEDGKKLLQCIHDRLLEVQFDLYYFQSLVGMLKAQIEGRNDSWAIRWIASAFLLDKLTLYPGTSLIRNIGFDDTGTHCGASNIFDLELDQAKSITLIKTEPAENPDAFRLFQEWFQSINPAYQLPQAGYRPQ
jgi:hypothetical protein